MSKLSDLFTWNNCLAAIIAVVCLPLFYMLTQEVMSYSEAAITVITVGLVLFGFFGHFDNYLGALLKLSSVLSICIAVVFLSRNIPDESIVRVIRIGAALMACLAVIVFLGFVYFKSRRNALIENGWLLETILQEVIYDHSDNFQNCRLKTTAKQPGNGEILTFISGLIVEIPSEKLDVGDVVKVYVDKKNPKRYLFDLD
ncbi:MAG: hypothetical protein KAQ67_09825 [Gammaproteobacteria bacterium]|nr:hypothetical protein [Gammaproteobacteria bacterium]